MSKNKVKKQIKKEQLNLFDDYTKLDEQNEKKENELVREEKAQEAFVKIKNKYGKNAVLKGMSYKDKSMSKERNMQIPLYYQNFLIWRSLLPLIKKCRYQTQVQYP